LVFNINKGGRRRVDELRVGGRGEEKGGTGTGRVGDGGGCPVNNLDLDSAARNARTRGRATSASDQVLPSTSCPIVP